jgi:flagellum-specific peptidoglycan hydrolase FlgJ
MKKLILTLFLSLIVLSKTNQTNYEIITQVISFSELNVYKQLVKIGIAYPDVVLAQAKIETGNFTSRIFTENNNMFGMKLPERRETTAVGENRNHAKYTDWIQSIKDYKLWQDQMIHRTPTKRAYLAYLKRNYAEDKNYINKIKKTVKSLKMSKV